MRPLVVALAVAIACLSGTAEAGTRWFRLRQPKPQLTRKERVEVRLKRVDQRLANLTISTTWRERAGSQPVDLHYWKFRDANDAARELDEALADAIAEGMPVAPIATRAGRLLGLMEPFLAQHFHVPPLATQQQVWQWTEAVNRLPILRRLTLLR